MTSKDRGTLALQLHDAVYELLKDTDLVDIKEEAGAGV
jgi:hypothetical protein